MLENDKVIKGCDVTFYKIPVLDQINNSIMNGRMDFDLGVLSNHPLRTNIRSKWGYVIH